jgi:2-C-methyl-D-erythritol 4-phosphate cytidylyltransferase
MQDKPTTHNLQPITKSYVIIVAGGSGSRMKSALPKQFLLLIGKPVLMHTMEAFYKSDTNPQIILVLSESFHSYWKDICDEHNFQIPHSVLSGGDTRFHSVKNGLDSVGDDVESLVAVHDAVRPLISTEVIDRSFAYAAKLGNAVVAVQSRDSVRQLRDGLSTPISRDEIHLVQTPQIFQSHQLKKAYLQPYNNQFTDDASVVEKAGFKIHLIEGNHQNIKITFPEDIDIAAMLLNKASIL